MTTLTWIGGGNNKASKPSHWLPNQAPQAGDSLLIMDQGSPITMNISGNDLAGDPLLLLYTDMTANLSHRAVVSLVSNNGGGTFNLSQHATLSANFAYSSGVFNLSGGSTLSLTGAYETATINISGHDTATLGNGLSGYRSSYTVNLQDDAKWSGTFYASGYISGRVVVNGGEDSKFNNKGVSTVSNAGAVIGADVVGAGSFNVTSSPSSRIEFVKSVSGHQSIADGGLVQIDRPDLFHGRITLNAAQPGLPAPEIDLMGLASADSYSFANGKLKIYAGNKLIDKLRLQDSTPYGFAVEAPTAGGRLSIVAITDPAHVPAGLPLHGSV